MKIKIQSDLINLSAEFKNESAMKDVFDAMRYVMDSVKLHSLTKAYEDSKDSLEVPEYIACKEPPELPKFDVEQEQKQDSTFKIRERIPNNVVEIGDLNVKQAITEKALVRCPECGQSHCLAVYSNSRIYFMERQYENDEFSIIAEFDQDLETTAFLAMCCKEDTDREAYFRDLQSAKTLPDKDFAVDNNTDIFCPVCHKTWDFLNWKSAYETPLDYFETEELCDACGGENVTKVVKGKKVTKCEKCGHETKYKEE